jgi:hypothetical protein
VTPLMARPYTDPAHAYNVVMTAEGAHDSSTPDCLLGIALQTATDCPHAPIALQRCESDEHAVQGDELPDTPVQ